MWDSILDILTRKAAMGVEVRIIYDDIGCIATLPPQYDLYIESLGINMHCLAFNPFVPMVSLVMNYQMGLFSHFVIRRLKMSRLLKMSILKFLIRQKSMCVYLHHI